MIFAMKKGVVLFFACVLFLVANAGSINDQEAAIWAGHFWKNKGFSQAANAKVVQSVVPVKYLGHVVYYQVNMAPEGWVLIAATDASVPVLAYATSGAFDNDNLPINCAGWLRQYEDKLTDIIQNELDATPEIAQQWEDLKSDRLNKNSRAVEPFLTTTWNQSRYYNDMCPADPAGPGGHCYAGCVPTAMGQICNYFRWPETGLGQYSYMDSTYGLLSADFENTSYRWDEMAIALSSTNLAVAELLYHLGISCDLVYGPDGSGMYNHKAAYALRTFFKYDQATEYVYRDSTSMDWDSLLITHLDRRIPLYYAGWSVPNINGHAFVCDGYQEDHFYHFNWGWGGSSDGYFYTEALNPSGSNFNLAQELIINCAPDSLLYNYPSGCSGYAELITTNGTIDDGSGPLYGYEAGTNCSWLIAPEDSVSSITLHFLDFDLTAGDTLFLYKGSSSADPLFSAIGGDVLPEDIQVDSDKVFVDFVVQSSGGASGWLMSFMSEIPVYCSSNEVLTEVEGVLNDGSGPRDYHNVAACMWMIAPPGVQRIELQFDTFETESVYDVVTVYDGNTVLGEFSGNELPPLLTATSGTMFLVFTTNFDITAPGWSATYTTDLVGVSDVLEGNQVLLVYPNPADQQLVMQTDLVIGNQIFELLDCSGRVVQRQVSSLSRVTFDVGMLPRGMYFAKVQNDAGVGLVKVVIQ